MFSDNMLNKNCRDTPVQNPKTPKTNTDLLLFLSFTSSVKSSKYASAKFLGA